MVIEQVGVRSADREGTLVLSVVNDDDTTPNGSLIDETVRVGARFEGGQLVERPELSAA
ncbi:hypothetical protein AB0A94_21570 [Streptomyces sp. NPDC044984]|uniref:hypothetical protein n=1 Tax=Streptomyces sp. NPDC044984 TaxID=3154335 RepID=UPI0033EF29AF